MKTKIIQYYLKDIPKPLRKRIAKKCMDDYWMINMFNGNFAEINRVQNIKVFIAMLGTTIKGFLTVHLTKMDFGNGIVNCNEFNIMIIPKWRRKGLASTLIKYAKENVSHKKTICFPQDKAGELLYKKHNLNIFNESIHKEINPL